MCALSPIFSQKRVWSGCGLKMGQKGGDQIFFGGITIFGIARHDVCPL